MKNRIGFFGGCFNPITNAHVGLIKQVIEKEHLEKVYFVPMGDWYAKEELISLEHRMNMLSLAFEKENKMEILNISNGKSKTCAIDTFQIIDEAFPKAERFFIMGSDNYKQIHTWKNAEKLNQYRYIVLDREQGSLKNVSSSLVRNKIKQGQKIENLLPNQVLKYIEQKKLYK